MQGLLWAIFSYFISPILSLLQLVILVYIVLSWLLVFGVIPRFNPTTRGLMSFCEAIINPLVRPIRKIIPPIGNFDFSLFVLILVIGFLQGYAIPTLISLVPF
ncbi:MAG TPA: YggT family protein [Hyphomonadaceae bacterium]|nr:YggT family protein [Hyphomonadaceae bacterium]